MLYQVDILRFKKGSPAKRRSTHTVRCENEAEVMDEFKARYGDDLISIKIEVVGSNSKASYKRGTQASNVQ